MIRRGLVPLASLAWSFGVIALLLQWPSFNFRLFRPRMPAPPSPFAHQAEALRDADHLNAGALDPSGCLPFAPLAWRMLQGEPGADSIFKHMAASGSMAGQLYAIAALRTIDPIAYRRGAARLRARGSMVSVTRTVRSEEPIAKVLDAIEAGKWKQEYLPRYVPGEP